MKVTINIEKRYAYVIIGILISILGFLVVNAYNSGDSPSVMGHSADEIDFSSGINSQAVFNNTVLFNGNIGIGTNNPLSKLHVVGENSDAMGISNADVTKYAFLQGDGSIHASGNILSGGTICDTRGNCLGSSGTSVQTPIVQQSSSWSLIGSSIHNANTGSVGIGINTPSQKLDVNGNINIRGSQIRMANTENHFYGDSANNLAARMNGYFAVQNPTGTLFKDVKANDYYIAKIGMWASELGSNFENFESTLSSGIFDNPSTEKKPCPMAKSYNSPCVKIISEDNTISGKVNKCLLLGKTTQISSYIATYTSPGAIVASSGLHRMYYLCTLNGWIYVGDEYVGP